MWSAKKIAGPSLHRGVTKHFTNAGDLLKRIEEEASSRLARAFAPKSRGVLQSALRAFARFAAATPTRALFHTPASVGWNEHEIRAWNEWSLILFATHLSISPSKKTGRPIKAESVSSYVSMVKGFFSFTYAFTLCVEQPPRLSRYIKLLKSEDPLAGIRRKRRALRRRHLRKAWKKKEALRENTPNAVNKWASITTAWHALARGGELCGSSTARAHAQGSSDPGVKTAPMRADLSFGKSRSGKRYACLMLRPLKKKGDESSAPVPQFFEEHDGEGSDAFAALDRLERFDPVPNAERATTPLFRLRSKRQGGKRGVTKRMSCSQFRQLVRDVAHGVLGLGKRKQWGAHSPRIGGATDLAATGKACVLLLQAKGRWGSDIGRIYARMTRRSQLAASRLMQSARGRDLEEIMPEFVQSV